MLLNHYLKYHIARYTTFMHVTSEHREEFERSLEAAVERHRRGATGLETAAALTERLDALIAYCYRMIPSSLRGSIAVAALGGYGRRELCFRSDTDIIFLYRDASQRPEAEEVAKQLFHHLLNYGLSIGHSFRSIQECIDCADGDLESWSSMLESRFLAGSMPIYTQLLARMNETIAGMDQRLFFQRLSASVQARQGRYGESTRLLEPNIKNSAGGLRDLQTVLWMARGLGLAPLKAARSGESVTSEFLRSAHARSFLDRRILTEAQASFRFLMRVRNEMHLKANSMHDTLEFSFQKEVAETLGYASTPKLSSVQSFMKDYYTAARGAERLIQHALRWGRENTLEHLDRTFFFQPQQIDLRRPVRGFGNSEILRAFLYSMETDAPFSHAIEELVSKRLERLRPLRSPEETALFARILGMPRGVGAALHRMNELGLLARWIPEWKPAVAYFQQNIYHFYTVDEHMLKVLAIAEKLETAQNHFGEIFRGTSGRDVLYLACLFHDIAKPVSVQNHEVVGAGIVRTIMERLRYERDRVDEVEFLVRHHLLMEQVAFRRNLADPQTIIDFAAKFPSTRLLDLLYCLTHADLCAVNKRVWTDWKGMLLHELHSKASELIGSSITAEELRALEANRASSAATRLLRRLPTEIHEEARQHFESIDNTAYIDSFAPDEIAEHIRRLSSAVAVSTLWTSRSHFSEVTIIARDAAYALSNMCGVLSANDANIFDAGIFTRSDGFIIDRFRVTDASSAGALSQAQADRITAELTDVFNGRSRVEDLLARHRLKWKRKLKPLPKNLNIDIEFHDHATETIVDIFAPDTLGVLYAITHALSGLGINIRFAKIATRADGIVDTFYVTDADGGKIEGDVQRERIRRQLAESITASLAATTQST